MERRKGTSLIEVLVVIGILATLLAILLPAIQKVRQYAHGTTDQNNERQIVLALHQYAAASGGDALPGRHVPGIRPFANSSPLVSILPYLELPYADPAAADFALAFTVKTYLSPTDPTVRLFADNLTYGPTSYAVNQQVFGGRPSLVGSIPDGLSNTIALSQRYCLSYFDLSDTHAHLQATYNYVEPAVSNDPSQITLWHSGTFADPLYFDGIPLKVAGETSCSIPGVTFQNAPPPADADSRLPQSTQPSGLLVCMFDGSIRRYSSSVSEQVFWSAVTPAGGEVTGE